MTLETSISETRIDGFHVCWEKTFGTSPNNSQHIPCFFADGYGSHLEPLTQRAYPTGTMWINMENRAFQLNGNAKNTKVGELHIDLLVHGAENPTIYANIVLEDEAEHEPLGDLLAGGDGKGKGNGWQWPLTTGC